MRKVLEWISFTALVVLLAATALALLGPHRLPDPIPTHFDALGHPDGWGSPRMLLLLPAIATGIYLLMTWVACYPGAFNFPVRVTPRNREEL